MLLPSISVSLLIPFLPWAQCSFYDNPELELPAETGTPLDELKAKWDFEVSSISSAGQRAVRWCLGKEQSCIRPKVPVIECIYSGDFQAYQHSHISDM